MSVLLHKGFTNRSFVFFCSLSSLTSGDSNRCSALCSATFCSLSFFFLVFFFFFFFFEGGSCYIHCLSLNFSSLLSFSYSAFSLNFMEGLLVFLLVSFSFCFIFLKVSTTANKNILRQKTGMTNAPKHSSTEKIIIPKLSNPAMSNNLPIVFNRCGL